MSEDVFKEISALKEKGARGAVATVVARKGSAPMSGDAKMLVREDGSTMGTVGGGCLEAEVWQAGMNVIESGGSEKLVFDLTEKEAGDSGHICGGVVEIFVEPFEAYSPELLEEINEIRSRGGSAVLATVVQSGGTGGDRGVPPSSVPASGIRARRRAPWHRMLRWRRRRSHPRLC